MIFLYELAFLSEIKKLLMYFYAQDTKGLYGKGAKRGKGTGAKSVAKLGLYSYYY